jgi:hypothetical protein
VSYIHTHTYIIEYSIIKENEIMSFFFARRWMELEIIMLSEISQTQKDKYGGEGEMAQCIHM